MYTLGIVMPELEMIEKIHSHGFVTKEVKEKDQLNELDGILINVDQKRNNQTIKGLEWLTKLRKENYYIPTWVYTDTPMTQLEQRLCLHLGANGVFIKESETEENDFIIMKNTLNCLVNQETTKAMSNSLVLNREAQSLQINGQSEICFTRLEFLTISFLYDHADKVVTYQEISDYLWKGEQKKRKYRVGNIIFLIRKKLGEQGSDLIQTVRSKGFRLNKKYLYDD
ncbi:winged helix-turn-helix transcriptional regulator [Candidatus Enterococcus mansonii]|uniref:OmpR/PhoB-type domain-containing protein n=1 Tax=Candidatus Enterococcus mansonii TaxID=1834181 RepID=A0A242CHW8_9ENTE|nr:winged helix-turn-helix transcriptional regulator [Enterococcus sp. 4G2_DIV0659]OTO09825.1 hypothetical protein A5880_000508 [Enterococcus sp. 4G2_DIV0659]